MSAVQLHGQTIDYGRVALPQLHAAACLSPRAHPLPLHRLLSGPARPLTRTPNPQGSVIIR